MRRRLEGDSGGAPIRSQSGEVGRPFGAAGIVSTIDPPSESDGRQRKRSGCPDKRVYQDQAGYEGDHAYCHVHDERHQSNFPAIVSWLIAEFFHAQILTKAAWVF
jgi:hypothetical protein